MLAWIKWRRSTTLNQLESDPNEAKVQRSAMSGKYLLLYKYLENRYANTVVLTFSEIEDLLGFSLPTVARLREDREAPRPGYSDSWLLANRTARPNLLAQTVVFDRAS